MGFGWDKWRVRGTLRDYEISLEGRRPDAAMLEASVQDAEQLLWRFEGSDREIERALLALHDRMGGGRGDVKDPLHFDSSLAWDRYKRSVARSLGLLFRAGRLVVRRVEPPAPVPLAQPPEPVFPPAPPPKPPKPDVLYRYPVTVLDDTGEPVPGVALKFALDDTPRMSTTNGAGDGTVDWVADVRGTVVVRDLNQLRKRLSPRWRKPASPSVPGSRQRVDKDALTFDVTSGQRTTIVLARPSIVRTRLIGAFFDTDRCFLLPGATAGIRGMLRQYDDHPNGSVLVVGHADNRGTASYNDTLSLERAKAVGAYLQNDAAAWDVWFGDDVPAEKRWGLREIQLMLSVLPERADQPFFQGTASGRDDPRTRDAVKAFQHYSNDQRGTALDVDGIAGPSTRPEIIKAYMALEDTTLPDSVSLTTHGCGASFPTDPGDTGDTPEDRRVEIFVFDGPVDPAPQGDVSGPDATDYPSWLALLSETIDFRGNPDDDVNAAVRLLSVASANRTFPKPSWIPVLADISARLVADPSLHVLVVGNCDETGDADRNRSLSLARAQAVQAFLRKDETFFRARFDTADAGDKWDWQEIQWMLSAMQVGGEPCYAGYVDGERGDAVLGAIQAFQLANELTPTSAMDETTLTVLIEQYLSLLGEKAPEPDQVEVAAGGAGLVPRSFGPDSAPTDDTDYQDPDFEGFRRIELFLSTKVFDPAPDTLDNVSGPDHPTYEAWCKAALRELPGLTQLPVNVQVFDRFARPVSAGGSVWRVALDGSESSPTSFAVGPRGTATLSLEPGIYTVRIGGATPEQTASGLHVRRDETGGLAIRLLSGEIV